MAAAKAIADAAHGVEGSSVVTAMTICCQNFAIRVSGLGDAWFRGPLPHVDGKLFDGFTDDDVEWIGGESHITETVGLGGFAQAAAFALQAYQGGSAAGDGPAQPAMYEHHRRPSTRTSGSRTSASAGTPGRHRRPQGDSSTGIVPVIDGGLAGKDGGQIGAGVLRAPLDCFTAAVAAYQRAYPG